MNNESAKGMGIGILIGAVVGAAIGILYAPHSGKVTRAMIRDKADEARTKADEIVEEAREKAGQIIKEAKAKVGK